MQGVQTMSGYERMWRNSQHLGCRPRPGPVLRLSRQWPPVSSLQPDHTRTRCQPCCARDSWLRPSHKHRRFSCHATAKRQILPSGTAAGQVSSFMMIGVANRVLYRLALEPMKHYMFFLAQLQTFGYVLVYGTTLYMRWRKGLVDDNMLSIPKGRFVIIGLCEALGTILLMIGAAELPGAVLPLVSQTILVWSMLWSQVILHTRPKVQQVAGALLVAAGVIIAAMPASGTQIGSMSLTSLGICALSYGFPALTSVTKEAIFKDAQQQLGRPLDIFVVNTCGSICQVAFVVALLPLMLAVRGIPLSGLPQYLSDGWATLAGQHAAGSGAPLLPLLYVALNLLFNVVALTLVRSKGTLVLSLAAACIIPLNIYIFTLPLPFLAPSVLAPNFILGTAVLLAGLMVYNLDVWGQLFRGSMPQRVPARL